MTDNEFQENRAAMPNFRPRKAKALKDRTPAPVTAQHYVDEGLALENSGDRHQHSDKTKCARFYLKAIQSYDKALELDPKGDSGGKEAAYNRARLWLCLGTEEGLVDGAEAAGWQGGGTIALLLKALEAHQFCLDRMWMGEEEDVLYNTATVYVSLAEEYTAGDQGRRDIGIGFAMKATELFETCYKLQVAEMQAQEQRAQEAAVMMEDPQTMTISNAEQITHTSLNEASSREEQWVHIKEPIKTSDLVDTLQAKLDALTALCSLLPSYAIASNNPHYTTATDPPMSTATLMQQVVQSIGPDTLSILRKILETIPSPSASQSDLDIHLSIALSIAQYTVAVADAQFNRNLLSVSEYSSTVAKAFSITKWPQGATEDAKFLTEKAEAYVQLCQRLLEYYLVHNPAPQPSASAEHTQLLRAILTHYATAANLLTQASRLQPPPPAALHILRGDIELLRSRVHVMLNLPPTQLRKNAAVYYRGAVKVAEVYKERTATEVRKEANIKVVLAEIILGLEEQNWERIEEGKKAITEEGRDGWEEYVLEDAVRIGIIGEEVMSVLRHRADIGEQ